MIVSYKSCMKLPLIGAVVKIANAYAFKGNPRYVIELASWDDWWKRIVKKAFIVAVIALVLTLIGTMSEPAVNQNDIARQLLGVFPSLLGFGIGVFALVFVLPPSFVHHLQSEREALGFDASILAPDMAYPLLVLVVVLFIGACLLFLPPTFLGLYIAGFSLFYGIAVSLELVSMIFTTGYRIIRTNRLSDDSEQG